MARQGRVMTDLLRIETRQHELFGFDFGDAAPARSAIIFGLLMAIVWCLPLGVVLLAVTGSILPSPTALTLYLTPPVLATAFGWMEDEITPRRRRITRWVLALRWVAGGHRPIIALGRHQRPRDAASVMDRVGARYGAGDKWALLMPWRLIGAQQVPLDSTTVSRSDPVQLAPRVHHYGTDAAIAFMDDHHKKQARHATTRAAARTARRAG